MTLHNSPFPILDQILIVEDEPLIALDVDLTLLDAAFSTVVQASNAAAIEWLAEHTPAAVILDIGLKDGVSVGVAELLFARNIPLIVCSGSAPHDVADIYAKAVWLAKPFEPARLIQVVETLLLHDEFLMEVEQPV